MKPVFEILENYLPLIKPYLENFEINKTEWSKLIDDYDKILSKNFYFFFNFIFKRNFQHFNF